MVSFSFNRHASGHKRITKIETDEFLLAMYEIAYRSMNDIARQHGAGKTLELGSGPGPSRVFGHEWIRTDLQPSENVLIANRAEELPIQAESLDAIVMKDTWHHIPDVAAFLDEAHRVLKPGGAIVAFDPFWSLLGRFVYRYLHQEPWDTKTPNWTLEGRDPSNSNQALSYIVLRRDREIFDNRWAGKFVIREHGRHIGPSFLLSGGVSRRTRISGRFLRRLLQWEEQRGNWFDNLRFFHVFSITKL